MTSTPAPADDRAIVAGAVFFIAADVMLLMTLLGAALVLHGGDPVTFDAHWQTIPALSVLMGGGIAGLGGLMLLWRQSGWVALFVAALSLLAAVTQAKVLNELASTETRLIELTTPTTTFRQAQRVQGEASLTVRVGPEWTLSQAIPPEGQWPASLDGEPAEARVLAFTTDVPSRHGAFALYWLAAGLVILHWLASATTCGIATGIPLARTAAGIWTFWSALVAMGVGLVVVM